MDKEINQDQTMMSSIVTGVKQSAQKQIQNYFATAVCSEGNQCHQMCCASQCKQYAVVCAAADCQCHKIHYRPNICSMVNPKFILKKVEQQYKPSPQLVNYIDLTFQKLIDQISQFRNELERKVKIPGLTEKIRQFLQISKKEQFKHLTGQTVSKVLQQLNKQSKKPKENYAMNLQIQLERKWSKIQGSIKEQIFSLEKVINQFVNKNPSKLPFQDSKILSNQEQRKRLVQFFPQNKRNFKSKLLYRASENEFSAQKFHNKCDGIAHTLTLVQTQFNKVIGGYTPLTWKGGSAGNPNYQQDKSKESFIFSVTNNDKFTIKPGSTKQICHKKQNGPVFCNNEIGDLNISDIAKNKNNSFACIGYGYQNPKYKSGESNSYEMFAGGKTCHFKISQWQVYQLTF